VRGKILVVDDNPIIQRAVYFALRDHGYKILMCGSIYDAINIIREEQPDLILADLSFPPDAVNIGGPMQDGFFFIHWVRHTPEVKNIPIMILSGSAPETYMDRVAEADIKVCLKKPLDKETLLQAIQQVLGDKTPGEQPNQS
jgi:chemosensory pili system protein ChpA (sensor histidine kinase/response regulator)